VLGVGEWDFNYGLEFLREIEKKHGFTFINANIRREGESKLLFPPYAVREFGDLKVGFISVLGSDRRIVTMTASSDNYVIESPRDALAKYLPELRERADLIILLAQLRADDVRQMITDLGADSGIDIVVEGQEPRQYRHPNRIGDVIVVAANNQGKYVGQLDVLVTPEGTVEDATVTIHALDKNSPEIDELRKRVDAFAAENEQKVQQTSSFQHDRNLGDEADRFLGVHTCARCHSDVARSYAQTAHARAFQSLVTKGQAENPECVGCHVVGFDWVNGYDRVADPKVAGRESLKNVQCEACHGYGTGHDRDGGWAERAKQSCLSCHDSQNSPDFNYESYWSEIAH
jgi:2',3'-cyclic-nucleotide 2'-phosphodiesterase (5'-nucleotidase family)